MFFKIATLAQIHRGFQCGNLFREQGSVPAGRQVAQLERALAYADELQDGEPEIPAHAPDLAVHALDELHLQNRSPGVFPPRSWPSPGPDAPPRPGSCRNAFARASLPAPRRAASPNRVWASASAGVHEPVGQFPVRGEDDEPLREIVQPAHGEYPAAQGFIP